jgi:phosphatidylglycerol:prolipoprotein diacylglycerol transferase
MLSVIVAGWMCIRRAPRFGLTRENVLDMLTWAVVPGVLGARITYIVINYKDEFAGHPERIMTWRFEGLTSFGALIFGFLGIWLFCRRRGFSLGQVLDMTATPVLIAWGIGRVGCLLNGCCYGHVCEPGSSFCTDFGPVGTHIPAQFVDIVLMPLFAAILAVREKRISRRGDGFAWAMIGFSVSRFVYEFFRSGTADEYRQGVATARYLLGTKLTEGQLTSILIVVLAAIYLMRKRPTEPQQVLSVPEPVTVSSGDASAHPEATV